MALALKRDDGCYLYHHANSHLYSKQLDIGCVFTQVRDYVEQIRLSLEQPNRWRIVVVDVDVKESSPRYRFR
jgi:hypothetical protein